MLWKMRFPHFSGNVLHFFFPFRNFFFSIQINALSRPIFGSWTEVFILGFRPGSVVVDYHMKVGETKENAKIDKENLVEILRVMIEENEDTTVFEADSVVIEGKERKADHSFFFTTLNLFQ